MIETQLENSLRHKDVISTLVDVERRLALLPPNGATAHKKNNAQYAVIGSIKIAKNNGFDSMTFGELSSESPKHFKRFIDVLKLAKKFVGI